MFTIRALLLALCLVTSAFSTVPPNATEDTHYPPEEPAEKAFAMARSVYI
jgi:hypothetical protein